MSYVLKLCGWYPSELDVFSGDFVQRHAKAIASQYPVVVVFATKELRRNNGGIRLVKNTVANLEEYIFYYPQRRMFDTLWSQWYYLSIIRNLLPALIAEKGAPSLVHVNIAWKPAIWAAYIRKRFDWPVVVTEHSTEYQKKAILNIRSVGKVRQKLTKELFQRSKRFISVSKQLVDMVSELYGPIPFSVVPNAVDTNLFYPAEKQRTGLFRLLHISTLGFQKNPEGLMRVLSRVLESNREIEVEIIGPETEALGKWMKHENNKDRIIFTGLIPYETVAKRMQQADLLVLFSRYENLPCVILEAFCCGLPAVSTDVGGISEIISKQNGLLVAEGDEDGLFQAIENVFENRMSYDQKEIAAEAFRRYSYEVVGKAFMKAYQEAGIQPNKINYVASSI